MAEKFQMVFNFKFSKLPSNLQKLNSNGKTVYMQLYVHLYRNIEILF